MHRRRKVDEKSCVTPTGTSNELDVQNKWEENTHTLVKCISNCCFISSWYTVIAMQGHQTKRNRRRGVVIRVIIYDNINRAVEP